MKGFTVDEYGKRRPLRRAEVQLPELGEHDALLRILAASLNPLDASRPA